MGRKQTFLSVPPNSNVEKQLVKTISFQVALWQVTPTKHKACRFVNAGQWSTTLETRKSGLLYGTCQQILRKDLKMQQIPQEDGAHGRAEAATSVCMPATLDEVRNNQTKPGHTVYNQKTNQQSSQWKSLSSSHTMKTFHILVTCYYTIWFFSIVLQSLSHVLI